MHSGRLTLDVNYTLPDGQVLEQALSVVPSARNLLSKRETWLDKYLDTFFPQEDSWWAENPDGDGLTNEEEFVWGTSPQISDTDGDGLHDSVEITDNFSSPILVDTDGDGLSDENESGEGTDPRLRDTDRDGLDDMTEVNSPGLDPLSSSGTGILSGRLLHSSYHVGKELFFRSSVGGSAWESDWYGYPKSFYLDGLVLDQNYSVEAFIDFDGSGDYEYGEPYAELNVTLSGNTYGLRLEPVDTPPELSFYDPEDPDQTVSYEDGFSRVVIDVNSTMQTASFAWTAKATDLLITDDWLVDSFLAEDDTQPESGQRIMVDGNFTVYLDQNFSGAAKIIDLPGTPWGSYELGFVAVDNYENHSSRLSQVIEIRDAQPPFLTLLAIFTFEDELAPALTTESNATISQVIHQNDLLQYDVTYVTENNATWSWPLGVPFLLEGDEATAIVNIRDNKDGEISADDWNISHPYGDSGDFTNEPGIYPINFLATDLAGNEMNFTLNLDVVPALEISLTAVDGYLVGAEVIFDADGDGVSDLNRTFITDSNGVENITFSQTELSAIDQNNNGQLDPHEGKFIVFGGTDEGSPFQGALEADANSTVVSPLTTLLQAMIDQNVSKEDALEQIAEAFGFDESVDLSTFDPLAEYNQNNQDLSTQVLVANLRIANIINQAEGLLRAINEEYDDTEIGLTILSEIGVQLIENHTDFNLENAMAIAIPQALNNVEASADLSDLDHLLLLQYIAQADEELASTDFVDQLNDIDVDDREALVITEEFQIFQQIEDWEANFSDPQIRSNDLEEHVLSMAYDPVMGQILVTDKLTNETFLYEDSETFKFGQILEINATANNGYVFTEWLGGVSDTASSPQLTLIMNADTFLQAIFEPKEYLLSMDAQEGGSVLGAGTYKFGEKALIVAQADDHFEFNGWEGININNPDSPSTYATITSNLFLQAKFVKEQHQLTLMVQAGEGEVSGGGFYDYDSQVAISAVPAEGYFFNGWTGSGISDTASSSTHIQVTEDLVIQATFLPNTYSVNLEANGSGTVQGAGSFTHGTNVAIFAEAQPGYAFLGWWENGVRLSTDHNLSLPVISARSFVAHFEPLDYSLTIFPTEGGITRGSGVYPFGSDVNISATPFPGYEFGRWIGNKQIAGSASTTTFSIEDHVSLTAEFMPILTLSMEGEGEVFGAGTYEHGSAAIISAKPATGYEFSGWSGQGVLNPSHSSTEVNMTAPRSLTAQFSPRSIGLFELSVEPSPFAGGTIGVSRSGNEVSVSATAAQGYRFVEWQGIGLDGSTLSPLVFTLSADFQLTAHFEEVSETITLSS